MKQNGQWLSQVRTRSKTAEATKSPSGSPSALWTTTTAAAGGGTPDEQRDVPRVGELLVPDDVGRSRAVHLDEPIALRDAGGVGGRALDDGRDDGVFHGASLGSGARRTSR